MPKLPPTFAVSLCVLRMSLIPAEERNLTWLMFRIILVSPLDRASSSLCWISGALRELTKPSMINLHAVVVCSLVTVKSLFFMTQLLLISYCQYIMYHTQSSRPSWLPKTGKRGLYLPDRNDNNVSVRNGHYLLAKANNRSSAGWGFNFLDNIKICIIIIIRRCCFFYFHRKQCHIFF